MGLPIQKISYFRDVWEVSVSQAAGPDRVDLLYPPAPDCSIILLLGPSVSPARLGLPHWVPAM